MAQSDKDKRIADIEVNITGTLTTILKSYNWLKPVCLKQIFTPPGKSSSVLELASVAIKIGIMCSI